MGRKLKTKHPLYYNWRAMMRRCYDINSHNYHRYGGRGIKVCEEWHDFWKFAEDIGEKKDPSLTVDRIDNDKDYSKKNCRLATQKEQVVNRSMTIMVGDLCLKEHCKKYDLNYKTITNRLNRLGWPLEKALNTPIKSRKKGGKNE